MISTANASYAATKSLSINVYLKLEPNNEVISLIKHFNSILDQYKLLKTYKIKPFLTTYPLHITLYLSNYKKKQLPQLFREVKMLTQREQAVAIITDQLNISSNAYVMLEIKKSTLLQNLSNKVVARLSSLRDKESSIPSWASDDLHRVALFKQWGSPSIYAYFQPHFSIIDPKHLSPEQIKTLIEQLKKLVIHLSFQAISTANTIGIGIANAQGQITEELASFELKPL
jgi:transposase-like protein